MSRASGRERTHHMGARRESAKRRTVFRCLGVGVAVLCVIILGTQARERSFAMTQTERETREWTKRWVPRDDLEADRYPSQHTHGGDTRRAGGGAGGDDVKHPSILGGTRGSTSKISDVTLPTQTGSEHDTLKVMISTTTADSPGKILDWMRYHALLGVEHFFLFVEGQAAEKSAVEQLVAFPGVTVWEPSAELDERRGKSRAWKENWLGNFFDKPCNNELFVRQSLNMELAIDQARAEHLDWMVHIDVDELMWPGGEAHLSMKSFLGEVHPKIDNVVFANYEACPESDTVKVSLFLFILVSIWAICMATFTCFVLKINTGSVSRGYVVQTQLRARHQADVHATLQGGDGSEPKLLPHVRQR